MCGGEKGKKALPKSLPLRLWCRIRRRFLWRPKNLKSGPLQVRVDLELPQADLAAVAVISDKQSVRGLQAERDTELVLGVRIILRLHLVLISLRRTLMLFRAVRRLLLC